MNDKWLQSKHSRWNRLLLNGCWAMLVLLFFIQWARLHYADDHHWMRELLIPTAVQLIILTAAELFRAYGSKRLTDYGILIGLMLNCAVYAYISDMASLSLIMLIPIFASAYYCSSNKLMLTAVLSLISILLLNWNIQHNIIRLETAGMSAITIICSIVALQLAKLGRSAVQRSLESEIMYKELLAKSALMEKLVKTDAMTELYNHMTFHEYLDHLVIHHESSGMPLHLVLLDIDNFKQINDIYGHRAGDSILRRVSELIRTEVRGEDIAARYGGEEFAILLSDTTLDETYSRMERIRIKVSSETHDLLDGKRVTLSIGIARYRAWEGKESFFARTDAALYMAKNSGKNRIVCADNNEDITQTRTTSA
ncbi:GGDEF domain-containing protein [Paenibacillus xylaniclasticus]|uniref:GGDEF domain-containing protein n=1 Tax=Paenibacillus xylaniclasticus TaxID=588083 RepID=UPI0013DEC6B8|nr:MULTISPECIES: GGDEF domain-containing protein [Paenibacillus]